MRVVTVSGTRDIAHRSVTEYADLFAAYLGPLVDGAHCYVGGAKGIDTLALCWLASRTGAGLTVVVPGTVQQQPAEARQAIAQVRDRLAEVVELRAPALDTPAYHARNRWMVDRSTMTIGFPRAERTRSGTWQTLTYTHDAGKPHLIVPV
ncbi:hypothetical protein [Streptomyces sp. JW3]|uniref:hypothetical protein n=1 Tax=Streptomyces sp. JW3 TaxID=3456955 RepID=UPI003FA42F6F